MDGNRRDQRFDFREPVQCKLNSHENFDGSLSCDISKGGIRLTSNQFIPLNTKVTLQFRLRSAKILNISGRVAWVQKIPYAENYSVGIKFNRDEESSQSEGEFNQFVKSRRF